MISKWKMEMLTFLTSLTLVSVGFSSWQVSIPNDSELSATVGVDSVVHTDNFVSLATPTLFEYNKESGFVTYNGTTPIANGNKAYFTLNYTVNPANCTKDPAVSPFYLYNYSIENYEPYPYAVITCNISFRNSNDLDTTFFDNATSSSIDILTLNGNSIDKNQYCSVSTSGIVTIKFPTTSLTTNSTLEELPISIKFYFTIDSNKISTVCNSLANGAFTFNTILSGTYT